MSMKPEPERRASALDMTAHRRQSSVSCEWQVFFRMVRKPLFLRLWKTEFPTRSSGGSRSIRTTSNSVPSETSWRAATAIRSFFVFGCNPCDVCRPVARLLHPVGIVLSPHDLG